MYISEVKIKGFRNFKDDIINFNEKTLIIGENDIGKTNLIYALRILLDRSLSEEDIEPKESDFYVHYDTDKIEIQITFSDIVEDCIYSYFKGNIGDDKKLVLKYEAYKSELDYKLYQGKDEESLQVIDSNTRYYLKVLNLQYVSSTRDLQKYINREKRKLIQIAKNNRTDDEKNRDSRIYYNVERYYNKTNKSIENLNYVKHATNTINSELKSLSNTNEGIELKFNMGDSDIDSFINNLELVSDINGKSLKVGGDGKSNQIFLSLWSSQNKLENQKRASVTIYVVEEPEAHLHPHQQRKLADYLVNIFENQIIITTHSPQIACEFKPNSIIKLYEANKSTVAANNGCSQYLENSIIDFAFRMNIISAETFFSKCVFLVEGPSELLLYKALEKALGLDLDKNNISILSVEGVGFNVYVKLFDALGIKYIIRTDNDISKVPNKELYRCAGLERCIDIYKNKGKLNLDIENLISLHGDTISNLETDVISEDLNNIINSFRKYLEKEGIYLSIKDLEQDLVETNIYDDIKSYLISKKHRINNKQNAINRMQESKGLFMYNFLREYGSCLNKLEDSEFTKQIKACKNIMGG